jgi:hypothetical protein
MAGTAALHIIPAGQIQRSSHVVSDHSRRGDKLILGLEDGGEVAIHPYAYVQKGDTIDVERHDGIVVTIDKRVAHGVDGDSDTVRLYPPYRVEEKLDLPPHMLRVTFRERERPADWSDARLLQQYHYRGSGLNRIVGRRALILADVEGVGTVGYGVLSATLGAAKPRFDLFEVNFTTQMEQRLINRLVRIPRVVVHPEFRGVGLAVRLVRHMVAYAERHWDIAGYKPIMVEVIASMTDYHRFFQTAGFIEAGQTLGTGDKIVKPNYGSGNWNERANAGEYRFHAPTGPKPYLVYPLAAHVRERLAQKRISPVPNTRVVHASEPRQARPIKLNRVNACYASEGVATERTDVVRRVFGIIDAEQNHPVLRGFSRTIEPGAAVLITGASGTGKSTLLRLLSGQRPDDLHIEGQIETVSLDQVAVLTEQPPTDEPVVNQVGTDLHRAIDLLNSVGLAEAHLYLRRPSQLSEGQRYRLALARLCASERPIWVADEFASRLDGLTAAVVAKGVRRLATRHGATLLTATAHKDHFLPSLMPSVLIQLRWGGAALVHALKIRTRTTRYALTVRVENQGTEDLHEVHLDALDAGGMARSLGALGRITRDREDGHFQVPLTHLAGALALRVRTGDGVGQTLLLQGRVSRAILG